MKDSDKSKENLPKKSGHEKPLSLYPMTFEEAIKKLAKKPPGKAEKGRKN
jgi:hypothetical protein